MPRMDGELVALGDGFDDGVHVAEVEFRVDALAVLVHGQRDDVDVPGSLAVAEETAFNAVGAGHHGKFSSSNGRPYRTIRQM